MTRERLQSLPFEELKEFADRQKIDLDGVVDKETLINLMLEVFEELDQEREEANDHQIKVEAKKYRVSADEEILGADYPEIPERYGETRLVAMVRDPAWAFAYWEIREEKMRQLRKDRENTRLLLRIHDIEGVKFSGRNSNSSFDIPLRLTDSKWYINLPEAGRTYILELLAVKKNRDQVVARSNAFTTPRESYSEKRAAESIDGDEILQLSVHNSMKQIPGSGSIPQRIMSIGA